MSGNVERIAVSRLEAAHSRAGELVARQRRLNDQLDAYFREVAEVRELLRDEGSLWDGPAYDPPVEAAFGAWTARGPKETRVELSRVAEAPLPSLEPERRPRMMEP